MTLGSICGMDGVSALRSRLRAERKKVVVTNGCFDLLHVGHLRYLLMARTLGEVLWLGINDDAGVKLLKGENRPIHPAEERAELLAALRLVDVVTIFPGKKATAFLKLVTPDVYAKGGDYTVETLDAEEREALQAAHADIRILPLVPGRSTTSALAQLITGSK